MKWKNSRPDEMTRYEWSVSRWIASETRLSLDPAGRGIYRDLLDLCYMTGSIPSDMDLLCRLTSSTPEEMERAWPVIKRHFQTDKHDHSRMRNSYADITRKNYFSFLNEQRAKASKKHSKTGKNNSNQVNEIDRVGSATAEVNPEQWQCQRGRGRGRGSKEEELTPPSPSFEGGRSLVSPTTKRAGKKLVREYTLDFEAWWQDYPRKDGKGAAFDSWMKLPAELKIRAHEGLTKLLPSMRDRIRRKGMDDGCPHASTWLNQGRWDDAPPPTVSNPEPRSVFDELEDEIRLRGQV